MVTAILPLDDERLGVHQDVRVDDAGLVTRGARMVESCRPLFMAEVVRRRKRIARLPLAIGDLGDYWSVASATTGWIDVYADSVVITATAVTLKASHPSPDTLTAHVDSLVMGLATGKGSWSMTRQSVGISVGASLRKGESWTGKGLRFMIPIDRTVALAQSWPVMEVVLSVPASTGNPTGRAWTYAFAAKTFFGGMPAQP